MKNMILLSFFSLILTQPVMAKDCTLAVYKTYMPKALGKLACDEQGLPADFAGNLPTLFKSLKALGYQAVAYDQCSKGSNSKQAYSLVSQLGNCVQTGYKMKCQLYVALYDGTNTSPVYENTVQAEGTGSVTLHLSEALSSMPHCAPY